MLNQEKNYNHNKKLFIFSIFKNNKHIITPRI